MRTYKAFYKGKSFYVQAVSMIDAQHRALVKVQENHDDRHARAGQITVYAS